LLHRAIVEFFRICPSAQGLAVWQGSLVEVKGSYDGSTLLP